MKKIIISENPWQTRIAVTMDDRLQNIYFESHVVISLERSYFKGIVTKVLPGIQTAFVDIGQEKAGFLHISEIDREMAFARMSDHTDGPSAREQGPRRPRRSSIDISKILHEGDEILVQVNKEPIYEKGAKLTTCFTLPGRYIVLMPNIPRSGVSKKIEEREERNRLKELVLKALPEGMGAIIRTTCEHASEQAITKDIEFLLHMWQTIQKKFAAANPKEKVHEDLPLVLQVVRDSLDEDVEAVIVNTPECQHKVYKFIKHMAQEQAHKVKLYQEPPNLFDIFNINKQIAEALEKKVELKSGGSLIIETTEAMTVIDVNTGKFIGKKSLEDTILKTNLEAAQEVVRQLRLRNIGGLIVIDFIDMAIPVHRQNLIRFFEKTLREEDKFQSVVLKVSEFGLVQMTRKRSGITLAQQLMDTCPTCSGNGFVKSLQTQSDELLDKFKKELQAGPPQENIILRIHPTIFKNITHIEYNTILELEKEFKCHITLVSEPTFAVDQYKIERA
jgi:ribonuclease G